MPRRKAPLSVSPQQREQLEQWLAAPGTPQGVVVRCRIVLAASAGNTDLKIAADLHVSRPTVLLWRERFSQQGLECVWKIAPGGRVPLHLVMDNYGSHKHPNVQAWLQRHPRFFCHFVPTSCSWLNLIERWFGELTSKRVRRGSFFSVAELQQAIQEFLAAWNEAPRPFVWTATVESITAKLSRCRQTLEQIQPGCTLPRTGKKKNI